MYIITKLPFISGCASWWEGTPRQRELCSWRLGTRSMCSVSSLVLWRKWSYMYNSDRQGCPVLRATAPVDFRMSCEARVSLGTTQRMTVWQTSKWKLHKTLWGRYYHNSKYQSNAMQMTQPKETMWPNHYLDFVAASIKTTVYSPL